MQKIESNETPELNVLDKEKVLQFLYILIRARYPSSKVVTPNIMK